MPHKCVGICDRFLRNIKRFYGRLSTTEALRWKGSKTTYDDRVYDRRVMKGIGTGYYKPEDYRRCTPCGIILLKTSYTSCPCCGNTKLTLKVHRGGRNYNRSGYIYSGQP